MEEIIKEFAELCGNLAITQDSPSEEFIKEYFERYVEENNKFTLVSDKEPPTDCEILVKSPEGVIHLASWRSGYKVFTCQVKSEDSSNWSWKLIE